MDDDAVPTSPATAEAPAPAPASAPDAAPAPVDAGSPPAAPWEGKTPEELWKLNGELRDENVRYKERFRPYEQTFGNFHPEDAAFLQSAIADLASPDQTRRAGAAEQLRAALDQLSPAQQKAVAEAVDGAPAEEWDPYDPKSIDERVNRTVAEQLAQAEAMRQEQRAIEDAQTKLKDRGTELASKHGIPDFGDPTTPLGELLYIQAFKHFPDEPNPMVKLERAAEAIATELGVKAQALLKAKSADAGPSPAPADAEAPSGTKKPLSMEDARRSATQRLDAILAGEIG